jgi:hypothetical protein
MKRLRQAMKELPLPDVFDSEGFEVIEWDRGPGCIFTIKVRLENGMMHWASREGEHAHSLGQGYDLGKNDIVVLKRIALKG